MFLSQRATCTACGAPLPLTDSPAIVLCSFCGGESNVALRARMLDPEVPPPEPKAAGDPVIGYEDWTPEQLVHGLAHLKDPQKRLDVAERIQYRSDRVEEFLPWIPKIIQLMFQAARDFYPKLDKALGVDLHCFIRNSPEKVAPQVLDAAARFEFTQAPSEGILNALHGVGGTAIKSLVTLAERAEKAGKLEYGRLVIDEAFRIIDLATPEQRPVCTDILLYRYPYVAPAVQGWIRDEFMRHLSPKYSAESDPGKRRYEFLYPRLILFVNELFPEAPGPATDLADRIAKIGFGYVTVDHLLAVLRTAAVPVARRAAAGVLVNSTRDGSMVDPAERARCIEALRPLLDDPDTREAAGRALLHFESNEK